jgi:hypothetical protein
VLLAHAFHLASASKPPRSSTIRLELMLNQYHYPNGGGQQDAQEFLQEFLGGAEVEDLTKGIACPENPTSLASLF